MAKKRRKHQPPQDTEVLSLRVPTDLVARIDAHATADGRNRNNYLVRHLSLTVPALDAQPKSAAG